MGVFSHVGDENPFHGGPPRWLVGHGAEGIVAGGPYVPGGDDVPPPPDIPWGKLYCTNVKRIIRVLRDTADELDDIGDGLEKAGDQKSADKYHTASDRWDAEADEGERHLQEGDCLPGGTDD